MSRVAVVTGGASGIGLGVGRRLAAAGHRVALLDLEADAVQKVAADLGVGGYAADVSDRAAVDAALDAVRADLGPIAIMVTCAGIDTSGPFTEITLESWERVLQVNLTGTFHCIQAVVPDMVEAGWGRIVTISSSSAQSGAPDRAAYAASKGGVIGFTKALAVELASKGITVNTIPPSIIDTPMARAGVESGAVPPIEVIAKMTPVGRAGTPDDIAAACEFLCSDDAGFITGQQIGVNGGWYI
jgi:NAD(P)-dependent dehydrogenase (short-subunit alcohol dehydrogenase family)